MLRTYNRAYYGPWKGMNLDNTHKGDDEVSYAINVDVSEGWRKRRGFDRFDGMAMSVASGVRVCGLYQMQLDESYPNVGNRVMIAAADATTEATNAGVIYYRKTDSGATELKVWTAFDSLPNYAGGPQSFYQWSTIHGRLYFINKYCKLMSIDWRRSPVVQEVKPVDGYDNDLTHICYLEMPTPQMLGSYKGRIVIGNFNGNIAYRTTTIDTTVGAGSPQRTVLMSDALTDFSAMEVFQIAEFFTFDTKDEQYVVAQREFASQNIFFLSGSIWNLRGTTATEYEADVLSNRVGCIAPDSIQETPDGLMFMAPDGVWLLTPALELKKMSEPLNAMLMEMRGSYEANPFLIDYPLAWRATSADYRVKSEYHLWLPLANFDGGNMLELVYNYEHNAWTMHGMGAVLDPATGALNTSEYGRRASCACVFEYDDLTTGLAWGDEHGYVNELAPHNMDARMIGYLSPVAGNTYRLDYDPGASNGGADKCLVGASILITDDRTTAERAAGTFTDMRYSGNVRSISAYASNVLTVSGGGVGETYQDGAQVWIYWPIRSRIVTEAFTDDPASVKRLQKIMPRYRGRSSAAIAVKYQGNDDRFYPDDVLIKQAWQASSSNSGWFDNYMSMMRNNDSYGPQRSAFASANQYDMTVFCRTGDNLGRKFMLVFEEFSIEDFELYGWMLTHQVMGERGYLSKVKAP